MASKKPLRVPNPKGVAENVPPLTGAMLAENGVLWMVPATGGATSVAPHGAPPAEVKLMWPYLTLAQCLVFGLFYSLLHAAGSGELHSEWSVNTQRSLHALTNPQRGVAVRDAASSLCTCRFTRRSAKSIVNVLRSKADTVSSNANTMFSKVCQDVFKDPTYAESMATGAGIAFVTSRLAEYQPPTEEEWTTLFVACFRARACITSPSAAAMDDAHARAAAACASDMMALLRPGSSKETAIEVM